MRRLISCAVLSALLASAGCGSAVGPLGPDGDGGSATGIGAEVGQLVSFGSEVLQNSGDSALTIRSVELVGYRGPGAADDVVDVVEAGLYPLVDGSALAAGYWPEEPGWPEAGLLPAAGHVLEPGEEITTFFVLEGLAPGAYGWRGVAVEYEIDGRTHREERGNGFVICVPRDRPCPLRETLQLD
ncbi:hypothetical protein A7K94_0208500 [Modestobacter sp. VKM Ac-2676]|nr:hypothetical protein A7K94_0208500 [Modestobacter sp. VKM Ac-2676]